MFIEPCVQPRKIGELLSKIFKPPKLVHPTTPCQQQEILTICRRMADVPNVPELTTVRFAGSTTFAPLNKPEVLALIKKAHRRFPLEHLNPGIGETHGSSTGVKWLIENTHNLSFAQSSRPITNQQSQEAKAKSLKLQEVAVAFDILAIFVNPQLTAQDLKGLTLDLVRKIFLGEVRNWQQVGGPSRPITLIKRKTQASGTVDVFKEQVLNGKPYGANPKEVETTSKVIRTVAATPYSISFATAAESINQKTIRVLPIAKRDRSLFVSPCVDDSCQVVNKNLIAEQSYPQELTKHLFVVIKRDGTFNEQAGVAYANILLSDEGQKLIETVGFVPLRRVP